ncbi:MAG: ribulose-phosphate 3-epimerase [Bacteroidales bacterium]
MQHLIAPSILSADFGALRNDIEMLNRSDADWIHVDIMDGMFVPNISFGFPVLKVISQAAEKLLDVHLMIVEPERYFEEFKKAGAGLLSIHIEANRHLHRSIAAIRQLDMKAGVVLNPHTTVNQLEDIITEVDLVLLMSVNPGYGGQKFIENTYSKISQLRNMIIRKSAKALIEVDGGVTLENAPRLIETGADVLVAGNTVFASDDPMHTIALLKSIN